jgi:hypothetical protein
MSGSSSPTTVHVRLAQLEGEDQTFPEPKGLLHQLGQLCKRCQKVVGVRDIRGLQARASFVIAAV